MGFSFTQTEIDELLKEAEKDFKVEAKKPMAHMTEIEGLDLSSLTTPQPKEAPRKVTSSTPKYRARDSFMRSDYEDSYTYVCSDCGNVMEKNIMIRPSHIHVPILTCKTCKVTITYTLRK